MKKALCVLLGFAFILVVGWLILYREKDVPATQFRDYFVSHTEQTISTWRLYKKTPEKLCFEYSRPIVPERFCVSRSELRAAGPNGAEPDVGFIYADQLFLTGASEPFRKRDSAP